MELIEPRINPSRLSDELTTYEWQVPARKRRHLHGAGLFIAGLELWYYAQFHWFTGNFRLQAAGIVLLIYWVLGGLFMMRQRTKEVTSEPPG